MIDSKISEIRPGAMASTGGPQGPDNGDMEARVGKLEAAAQDTRDRLIKIETKLDGLPSLFATKADVAEAKNSIIIWVIGTVLTFGTALTAITFFIARNVH